MCSTCSGQHRKDETFKKACPTNTVPAIDDDGFCLFERWVSLRITCYRAAPPFTSLVVLQFWSIWSLSSSYLSTGTQMITSLKPKLMNTLAGIAQTFEGAVDGILPAKYVNMTVYTLKLLLFFIFYTIHSILLQHFLGRLQILTK